MRKIVLITGVFALTACAGEAEAPAEEAVEVAETEEVAGPVGNYTWTEDDGTVMSASIDADGTTQVMNADGETVDSGTWEHTDEGQTCFVMEGMEEGADPACWTFSEPNEEGAVEITDGDGETNTVNLVS